MLTMSDAERAFTMVLATYEGYILPELKKKTAREVFLFCDEQDFALRFDYTYQTAFKQANSVLIPGLITAKDINGFVTAEVDYDKRKVCIPKREGIAWPTLVHESLHYVSHQNFYPTYYLVGGQHPFQVEGATEYLTRATSPSNVDLQARKNSQNHFLRTSAWLDADRGNYGRMVDFFFKGVTCNLDSIHS